MSKMGSTRCARFCLLVLCVAFLPIISVLAQNRNRFPSNNGQNYANNGQHRANNGQNHAQNNNNGQNLANNAQNPSNDASVYGNWIPPDQACEGLYSVYDFKEYARQTLDPKAYNYIDSGATLRITKRLNRESFNKLTLRPRFMVNVSNVQLSTTVLGEEIAIPIGVSPAAAHQIAHPDGENGTVRAVAGARAMMIVSSYATVSMEEIAANAAPDTVMWLQVHILKNRSIVYDMVKRAENLGFKAIVLGVDVPTLGVRYDSKRDKYFLPPGGKYANFVKYGTSELGDPSATWNDAVWLRSITHLPIVAKGILTVEDALQAVNAGIAGIIVSNHGGRQLDSSPATIDVLPKLRHALNGKAELYLDSGIRTGIDILKALALGARAVFIGRPNFWGLSYGGAVGSRCVLDILTDELRNAMMLTGTTSVRSVPAYLVSKSIHC